MVASRRSSCVQQHPCDRLEEMNDDIRLTPTMFGILLALSGQDKHGYAVMQEVQRLTGARLEPATLYRSIKQLLSAGLIAEADERPDPELDDERRRYYRLTAAGEAIAVDEARRLSAILQIAQIRGLLPGGAT
jgi:DNA-binding PadR family transcriptional regulator